MCLGEGGGGSHFMQSRSLKIIDPRIPTGTEHVWFSPIGETSRAPGAKRRQVFTSRTTGELHRTQTGGKVRDREGGGGEVAGFFFEILCSYAHMDVLLPRIIAGVMAVNYV